MNASIVRLFVLVVVLFGTLVGFTSYWSVFEADDLEAHRANRRPLLEQMRIRRGEIGSRENVLLAESVPRGRGGERIYTRRYPVGEPFGHPVGYSFVERGQSGLEKFYNDDLVGEESEFASILEELRGQREEGDSLRLALDASAQRTALQALAGRAGSVVAIEPQSGRVRAMASTPGFNPNRVPDDFGALNRTPGEPLFNRATQSRYPPGSTFKVVAAAAALDGGDFSPDTTVNGRSGIEISGVPLQNFGGRDFGQIPLTTALTNSVNTVWAQVGERLGKERVYEYMDRFGLNSRPPLDYPPEQLATSGVFGDGGRNLLDEGDSIDIGRVAIGQERLQVTPLQMAMVAAAVANDGVLMRPRLGQALVDPDGREREIKPRELRRVMSEDSARQLQQMMGNVVREGTGTAAALEGIEVGGKTGTAERGGDINQAWFIGFAPLDAPRIAVAATVERTTGQGGTVAAPIAKQVMQQLLGGNR